MIELSKSLSLTNEHLQILLQDYFISRKVMSERRYTSITCEQDLIKYGVYTKDFQYPGLFLSSNSTRGIAKKFIYIPDNPLFGFELYSIRYFSTKFESNLKKKYPSNFVVDCPRSSFKQLKNPQKTIYLSDSFQMSDSLASRGLCAITIFQLSRYLFVEGEEKRNEFLDYLRYSFELIAWENREVRIVERFEEDFTANSNCVAFELNKILEPKGAKTSTIFIPQKTHLSTYGYIVDLEGNISVVRLPNLKIDSDLELTEYEVLVELRFIFRMALCNLASEKFNSNKSNARQITEFIFSTAEFKKAVHQLLGKQIDSQVRLIVKNKFIREFLNFNFFHNERFSEPEGGKWIITYSELKNYFSIHSINFPTKRLSCVDEGHR